MQTLSVEQVLEETGWTKKWEERGRLEGKLEGRREGKLEAARKLINRGWKVQEVAETLDLDINTVLAL